jgi:hypothetical protein
MNQQDEVVSLLQRIEANQRTALTVQQEHLDLARAQLERSSQTIAESIELQRKAVARQAQLAKILLPIVALLLLLIVYLLFRWRIL